MTARAPLALALGTASVALALSVAGPAYAGAPPNVTGKKYSDAQTALTGAGFTPVVSTTVGDQKAWPDCLVTNVVSHTEAAPENSSGSATNEALVSLNCYSTEASATKAGYSAASPEGKELAAEAKKAEQDKASGSSS